MLHTDYTTARGVFARTYGAVTRWFAVAVIFEQQPNSSHCYLLLLLLKPRRVHLASTAGDVHIAKFLGSNPPLPSLLLNMSAALGAVL